MNNIFEATLGPKGVLLANAIKIINLVPIRDLKEAIDLMEQETAIGPLLNPTGYIDGKRFDNARTYKKIFKAVIEIREASEEALKQYQDSQTEKNL